MAFMALALLAPVTAAAAGDGAAAPSPDQSFVSGKDIVVSPPAKGYPAFRYLPGGPFIPFDRNLVLSAAPGEMRTYVVQVDSRAGGDGGAPVIAYTIDKRRPGAPKAEPGTGLYRGELEPRLSGNPGTVIFWALLGPSGSAPSFSRYAEDSRPRLSPPVSGTATYTLLAYAVDPSGNRGYPSRFVYRMAELGLPAAAPIPDSAAIAIDASLPMPDLDFERGYTELKLSLAPGSSLIVDVDPESPPVGLDDFERIDPDGGVAKLRLPCPYGWKDDLHVYYGILRGAAASYSPQPIAIHISNPADDISAPAAPEGPTLAADPSGRGAFAVFPSYDGAIYVSIEGDDPVLYSSPVLLPRNKRVALVSWYGQDDSGRRSIERERSLALPEALPDMALSGIADGASIAGDVNLKPIVPAGTKAMLKTTLRYEMRLDGSMPPEPSASSPLLGDSLAISCPAGEERSVVLRYRVFSDDAAGEGRILRFSLDRKPPEAPGPLETPLAFINQTASIVLAPGQGGRDIFASVSIDGAQAAFLPVTGTLELRGSVAGPVSYLVRAYDLDAAGNRSEEMKSLSIVVDRSSVFAAEDAGDKGDGSPDRPYRSLDDALAAAISDGRKNVNMRGALEMRVPVRLSSEIALVGGFGKLWAEDPSARAQIRAEVPQGQAAIGQRGGSLLLRRLDITVDAAGGGPFLAMAGASLAIEDSSISAGAEGDLVLVSAQRSKIDVQGSRIAAQRAMAFTAFSAEGCDITVAGSSISGEHGVRIFGAFDMDGGSLSLRQSLLESRADLALNMLSLRSASLLIDRSLLQAEGGSGFLRLGSFQAVRGELKSSKIRLSWSGSGTLFEISGGSLAFKHDTIVADSDKGALRFFDARGSSLQVWNSILECSGKASELVRSDSMPGQGLLVADCVWGFEKYLAGALETSDLVSLNALNSGSALYSSKPIVSEAPERSFAASLKSQAPLRADSACVNAALPLASGYEIDFSGHSRPGPGKTAANIGADELVD